MSSFKVPVPIFVVIFAVAILCNMGYPGYSSPISELGTDLGSLLSRWYRFQVFKKLGVEQAKLSKVKSRLKDSITKTCQSIKDSTLPSYFVDRVQALNAWLQAASPKGDTLYQQFFFKDDSGRVKLLGSEIRTSAVNNKIRQSYLFFSEPVDEACISISKLVPPYTIEFWAKLNEQRNGLLFSAGNWSVWFNKNILLLRDQKKNLLFKARLKEMAIRGNLWTHIGLTVSKDALVFIKNGKSLVEYDLNQTLIIGNLTFRGEILRAVDELRIHDEVLTPHNLNYVAPLDYLISQPLLSWAQQHRSDKQIWRLQAGLIVAGLKEKVGIGAVNPRDLSHALAVITGARSKLPEIPDDLPHDIKETIHDLEPYADTKRLSTDQRKRVRNLIQRLYNYLDTDND